jgi:hypothetical protein
MRGSTRCRTYWSWVKQKRGRSGLCYAGQTMGVFPRRRGLGRVLAFATPAIALSVVTASIGCGARPWQPPPPYGQTYAYDYQGFKASDTVVVAGGGGGGPAYAGVFAFRDRKGVHEEAGGKDPFTQSAPIDGYRFNTHLEGQGARLTPGGVPAVAPAVSVSVGASASVAVPK